VIVLLEPDDEGVFVSAGELCKTWAPVNCADMPESDAVLEVAEHISRELGLIIADQEPAGEVPAYACRIHESLTELEDERSRSSILESLCGSVPADLEAEVRERMGREISDELERLLLEGLKQS
jgi:hypothetical protein